ncbi:uncharacterized protein B0T23DRAFT_399586 [Neurospora hispaniola]|uniref:Uncharacterized protein n=1 Tax=Neurospora hispaniola TaxID=588809 RepID=A0AAJ0I0A3_9PEZI|nr:hypothetical protein B0T23DRAFT_399586 [Neurospora hispaniola]
MTLLGLRLGSLGLLGASRTDLSRRISRQPWIRAVSLRRGLEDRSRNLKRVEDLTTDPSRFPEELGMRNSPRKRGISSNPAASQTVKKREFIGSSGPHAANEEGVSDGKIDNQPWETLGRQFDATECCTTSMERRCTKQTRYPSSVLQCLRPATGADDIWMRQSAGAPWPSVHQSPIIGSQDGLWDVPNSSLVIGGQSNGTGEDGVPRNVKESLDDLLLSPPPGP